MTTANHTLNTHTLETAERRAEEFRAACRKRHPDIPQPWRDAIARILAYRMTRRPENSDDAVRRLLDSDGLDLTNWRICEHGGAGAARCLPHNWPELDANGLTDFVATMRLEEDPTATAEILREARWQLRCAPFGLNLLQETARQSCDLLKTAASTPSTTTWSPFKSA